MKLGNMEIIKKGQIIIEPDGSVTIKDWHFKGPLTLEIRKEIFEHASHYMIEWHDEGMDHDWCEDHEHGNHRFNMLGYASAHPEEMKVLQGGIK